MLTDSCLSVLIAFVVGSDDVAEIHMLVAETEAAALAGISYGAFGTVVIAGRAFQAFLSPLGMAVSESQIVHGADTQAGPTAYAQLGVNAEFRPWLFRRKFLLYKGDYAVENP